MQALTDSERETLRAFVRKGAGWGDVPYCPHTPTTKQKEFLSFTGREGFYGGAAGPGKSTSLLMAALQYVRVPGYAAIIFRKTFTDLALPHAVMSLAKEWLVPYREIHWSETNKVFTFPSGATLSFAYLEHENDKYRYQSAEFQFIGFDELSQFSESQFTYLFSRLRKVKGMDVPLRMRTASNPGDVGHEWVKKRYIDAKTRKKDALVLRGLLEDNPHIDESYEESLRELDPVTFMQLRHGNWDALHSAGMFDREWFPIVDAAPVADLIRVVRFWDVAGTAAKDTPKTRGRDTGPDYTAGVKMGYTADRAYYVLDLVHGRWDPEPTESRMKATAENDGYTVSIREEQEPGSSGKAVIDAHTRGIFKGYGYVGIPSTGNKETRAKPLSAAAHKGRVMLVRGEWNEAFLYEHHHFPMRGFKKDIVDATSGAFNHLLAQASGIPQIHSGGRRVTAGLFEQSRPVDDPPGHYRMDGSAPARVRGHKPIRW